MGGLWVSPAAGTAATTPAKGVVASVPDAFRLTAQHFELPRAVVVLVSGGLLGENRSHVSKLFVSDLDGTLLLPTGRISDVSLAIIGRLLADGLPFTVASARSVVSMREVLRGLPIRLPIIEFNGAYITELATGRHLHCESIATDAAAAVLDLGDRVGLAPVVATFNGQADRVYALPPQNDGVAGYVTSRLAAGDPRIRQVDDLRPALREQVVCLTFMDRREALEPLAAELRAAFDGEIRSVLFPEEYFPPWHWLAVYGGRATKAHAIEVLARDLGVSLDEVTVFGDQVNDIPMFEECGQAIAVANAVPELQQHADASIGPNTDDSVARYLAAHWRAR
jgi:5-amino-6-(5-phospho-D-ribitylamino)uracil phosphatase